MRVQAFGCPFSIHRVEAVMAKRKTEDVVVQEFEQTSTAEEHAAELAVARAAFPGGKVFKLEADGPSAFVVNVDGAPRKFYRTGGGA